MQEIKWEYLSKFISNPFSTYYRVLFGASIFKKFKWLKAYNSPLYNQSKQRRNDFQNAHPLDFFLCIYYMEFISYDEDTNQFFAF